MKYIYCGYVRLTQVLKVIKFSFFALNIVEVVKKSVNFAYRRDRAVSYFNLLQILTFGNIYKFKLALFIHKSKNHPTNIPAVFSGTLTLVSEVHSYNTRFATNFNSF